MRLPLRMSVVEPQPTPIVCATEGEPRGQLVVASEGLLADAPAIDGMLIAGLEKANAIVESSALPFGVSVKLRFDCDLPGVPSVIRVKLPSQSEPAFWQIANDLWSAGLRDPSAKYLVAYDGTMDCTCAGMSEIAQNNGGTFSIVSLANTVDGPTMPLQHILLHEYAHALGAVQLDSPHSTGGWHCTDGLDVMCYADNGPNERQRLKCPVDRPQTSDLGGAGSMEYAFDCNNDDYFHPLPPPGSYLARSWNVASPQNQFIAWTRINATQP